MYRVSQRSKLKSLYHDQDDGCTIASKKRISVVVRLEARSKLNEPNIEWSMFGEPAERSEAARLAKRMAWT